MAAQPEKPHLMPLKQGQKPLPEVGVEHGFFVCLAPVFALQEASQPFSTALRTYCESVKSSTSQGWLRASRAEITAISSMRLLVVAQKPPQSSLRAVLPASSRTAAQPPGPGFPRQEPSVWMMTFFMASSFFGAKPQGGGFRLSFQRGLASSPGPGTQKRYRERYT